jgi:hypothetical protein
MDKCPYCKAEFKTKLGFKKHQCKKKSLVETVGEANLHRLHILFNFWLKYNKLATKEKTYDEFLKSPYFASFSMIQVAIETGNIGDAKEYIIWLSKNKIRVDNWADPNILSRYKTYTSVEADGLEKVMDSMTNISNHCLKHNIPIDQFFELASKSDITSMITGGLIHPWLLFTSSGQEQFFPRLTDEAFRHLMRVVNADYWLDRVERDTDTLAKIMEFYNEIGYV